MGRGSSVPALRLVSRGEGLEREKELRFPDTSISGSGDPARGRAEGARRGGAHRNGRRRCAQSGAGRRTFATSGRWRDFWGVPDPGPQLPPVSICGRRRGGADGGLRAASAAGLDPSAVRKAEPRGCVSQPGPAEAVARPGLLISRRRQSGCPEPSRREAGRPGACGCLEGDRCVRAPLLAASPPYPPLSPGSCVPGKPSRDLLSGTCLLRFPRPLRTQSGAAAPESGPRRAHPDLPYPTGDPAYVWRQLIRSPLPARAAQSAQRWRCPWCCRFSPPEHIATLGALRGSVACPYDEFHARNKFTKELSVRHSSGHSSPCPPRGGLDARSGHRRCVGAFLWHRGSRLTV